MTGNALRWPGRSFRPPIRFSIRRARTPRSVGRATGVPIRLSRLSGSFSSEILSPGSSARPLRGCGRRCAIDQPREPLPYPSHTPRRGGGSCTLPRFSAEPWWGCTPSSGKCRPGFPVRPRRFSVPVAKRGWRRCTRPVRPLSRSSRMCSPYPVVLFCYTDKVNIFLRSVSPSAGFLSRCPAE